MSLHSAIVVADWTSGVLVAFIPLEKTLNMGFVDDSSTFWPYRRLGCTVNMSESVWIALT